MKNEGVCVMGRDVTGLSSGRDVIYTNENIREIESIRS